VPLTHSGMGPAIAASEEHDHRDANSSLSTKLSNEKAAKAYEFLKEEQAKAQHKQQIEKAYMSLKDDSRVQAYGWSLPSKSSLMHSSDTKSTTIPGSLTVSVPVPVPVYCRPLFEHDNNNLKLSCAAILNYQYDASISQTANCAQMIESSGFSYYKSSVAGSNGKQIEYKSSCIWLCNLNGNDTHVCVLDANKPGDLLQQFTLKDLKIHCIESVSG
jgi:hypothetical protein